MSTIISCRKTLFSTLSKNGSLQKLLKVSEREARAVEIQVLLDSSKLSRLHGASQSSLTTATYISQLVDTCRNLGLNFDAVAKFESSNVLWDQGEMTASILMLKDIVQHADLTSQDVPIGRPELLAKLVRTPALTSSCCTNYHRGIGYRKHALRSLMRLSTITYYPL